jgi:uncharacterized protein (DUF2062 family)
MKRLFKWIKEKVLQIARIDSTPLKIAVGIGLGAFIAMWPITGFQFITGILLSLLFRVNKVAVVVTTQLLCNPLTLPFVFFLDYKVGEKLLGHSSMMTVESFRLLLNEVSFRNLFTVLGAVAKPLYLGSMVMSPVAGLIAFGLGFILIRRFKRKSPEMSDR